MKDKKKMIVLGVLVVAILAIGAFQFVGPSLAPAPTVTTEEGATEVTGEDGLAEGETAGEEGSGEEGEVATGDAKELRIEGLVADSYPVRDPFSPPEAAKGVEKVVEEPVKPVVQPQTPRNNPPSMPGTQPVDPRVFGDLPPLGNPGEMADTSPKYRVKGVLVGERSVAVVEDEDGNQKLVPVGGSIDGDSTVTKIERGKITVLRNGKEKVLSIQEKARND